MWIKPTSLTCLAFCLCLVVSAQASVGDLSVLIENFMAKQFPEAKSRLWIVNGTQWETDNEVVVDMNAVVTNECGRHQQDRFFSYGEPVLAAHRRWAGRCRAEYPLRRQDGV
jgi:hypothetical protein